MSGNFYEMAVELDKTLARDFDNRVNFLTEWSRALGMSWGNPHELRRGGSVIGHEFSLDEEVYLEKGEFVFVNCIIDLSGGGLFVIGQNARVAFSDTSMTSHSAVIQMEGKVA